MDGRQGTSADTGMAGAGEGAEVRKLRLTKPRAFGYKPVNKYLPPRSRRDARTVSADTDEAPQKQKIAAPTTAIENLFSWVDRALSR